MRQWIPWWVLVGGLVLTLVGCGNGRPARHVLPEPTQAAFEQALPGAESTMVATGGSPNPGQSVLELASMGVVVSQLPVAWSLSRCAR